MSIASPEISSHSFPNYGEIKLIISRFSSQIQFFIFQVFRKLTFFFRFLIYIDRYREKSISRDFEDIPVGHPTPPGKICPCQNV